MKKDIEKRLKLLDSETQRIFDDLSGLDDQTLRKNGRGWSVIQVLNHLNKAEILSLQYMRKKMKAGTKMKKINVLNRMRMWITCGFLESGLKWKAPSYIANPPGDDSLEEMREKWKETRSQIEAYIQDYPDEWLDRAVYKHPMAGRLSLMQAIDSFIYHQRHHVHQIRRIKKELGI